MPRAKTEKKGGKAMGTPKKGKHGIQIYFWKQFFMSLLTCIPNT